MGTPNALLASLRVRLQDTSSRKWPDDSVLIGYLTGASGAESWYAGYFAPKPGVKLFRYRESLTLAANTETIALSTLTKRFFRLVMLWLQWADGYEQPLTLLDDADEGRARAAALVLSGIVVPRYSIQGDSLLFLPPATNARTINARYMYLPAIKAAGSTPLETPDVDDDLLVLRAAHYAQSDMKETNTAFEEEFAARIAETLQRLSRRENGLRGLRVRTRSTRILYR